MQRNNHSIARPLFLREVMPDLGLRTSLKASGIVEARVSDLRVYPLLFLLLLVTFLLLLPRPAQAQKVSDSPDFNDVQDILAGKRELLRIDDVVFGDRLLDTRNSKVTGQQTVPGTAFAGLNDPTARGEVLAHMFAGSGDTLDYTTADKVIAYDPRTQKSFSLSVTDKDNFATSLSKGDVTGDGYDDVVIGSASGVRVLAAVDPNDFGKGIRLGPLTSVNRADQQNAVGDFSGSGRGQIAQIVSSPDADIYIFSVNPDTLEASRIGQWKSTSFPDPHRASDRAENLAVGHFFDTNQDQLLFGKTGTPGESTLRTVSLELLNFNKSLQPQVRDTVSYTIQINERLLLESGHLDPGSSFDQVVQINDNNYTATDRAFTVYLPDSHIRVISFNGKPKIAPGAYTKHDFRVFNFSLGSFDRTGNARPILGQQLAVVVGFPFNSRFRHETPTAKLQIYNVTITPTPDGNTISFSENPTSEYNLGEYLARNHSSGPYYDKNFQNAPLVAGDLQARSIGLGNPIKVTVNSYIRPDVVLSLPPMHVDYAKPYRAGTFPNCKTTEQPCEINISVLPNSFRTSFSSTTEQGTKSVRKSTTSYGYSREIGGGVSLALGDESVASFSASYQYAVKSAYDNEVATSNNKYSALTDSLTSTTGFADHLFFTRERLNIWVYPIMGLRVCPGRATTCADAEKTQAYAEYSGPDDITFFDIDATTQDWYQPVTEPGNIFSYPWSVALFEKAQPDAGLLTERPTWRGIDTSASSYETNWTKESGKDISVGAKTLTTHDNTFTSAATVGAAGVALGTVDFSSNFSRSTGLETLEDSTISLTSNRGLTVDKPAFSSDIANNYGYSFAGFVYANRAPVAPPERPVVIAPDGQPASLQTRGPLLSAFLADLNPVGSQRIASFWTGAYDKPDIALNHPARWNWNNTTGDVTFNAKTSEDPIRQEFYWMKGLYVTPANADRAGPQRQETSVAEPVQLQARVYNYSLADVPEQDRVRVEFYGQLVDKRTNQLTGDAFRIDGVNLPVIPGFKSRPMEPNWALASTVFDPSQFTQTRSGNVYMAFWVVVWYEDPAGKKGDEVADHGLVSIPGNWSQVSQIQTEAYSNNVGLYSAHTPFYIAPRSGAANSAPQALAPSDQSRKSMVVESMTGTASHAALNSKVTLSATLHNFSSQAGPELVAFYDGDPSAGAKPFELQEIPVVPAGEVYTLSACFHPETPGVHTIYAVADPQSPNATTQTFTVTVDR